MMMLGQDDDDEVEVVTSHVVSSPFNTNPAEEKKSSIYMDEDDG